MSKRRLPLFFVCSLVAVLAFAATASAQDCSTSCDPYFSGCSDPCQRCLWYTYDGCGEYEDSTCGNGSPYAACIPDNCTPNWQEQSRVTQGTYDGRSINSCTHHLVQWVTTVDQNACNQVAYYRTYHYCDDVIDSWKNSGVYPSCCEGYGDNGVYLTCDGNHSCTG
jgi:hypothetical protein